MVDAALGAFGHDLEVLVAQCLPHIGDFARDAHEVGPAGHHAHGFELGGRARVAMLA